MQNDTFRKTVYVSLVALAIISLILAIAVTAGFITDEQVVGTLALTIRYASGIAGVAGGVLALKNFTPKSEQ